ncbi:hypothetical protein K7G98_32620, partial [Saccharothrix sp. MB29]|nr:hypothetical protein [Saccharothrix sp. MB29]
MSHRPVAVVLALGLALAACGTDAGDAGGKQEITVWLMRDSTTEDFASRFETEFERDHPDLDLDLQVQEWNGITQKVTSALASASGVFSVPAHRSPDFRARSPPSSQTN